MSHTILRTRGIPGRFLVGTLLAAFLALQWGCNKNINDKHIQTITIDEVRDLMVKSQSDENAMLLVDPRSDAEFAAGHLPGARNLKITDVDDRFGKDPELNRHNYIVVYGRDPSPGIASAMTKHLMKIGYKQARWFEGGLAFWRDAGLPIEGE